MSLTALTSKVLGAALLMTSCLLPGGVPPPRKASTEPTSVIKAPAETEPVPVGWVDLGRLAELFPDMTKLKGPLKDLGLGIIVLGIGAGSLSELGVGIRQKQPTVALGGLLFLATTPLYFHDSNLVRGLYLVVLGQYYAGYAHIIRNKFQQPPPEQPRQMTVTLANLARMPGHILADHGHMLVRALTQAGPLLKSSVKEAHQALKSQWEGKSFVLNPNADRIQLSALGHYLGGGLLMFSNGNPILAITGTTLATLSSISSNLEWFAIGTQRNDAVGTALKVGAPLYLGGKLLFFSTLGYSLEKMGQGLSCALSVALNDKDSPEETPPPTPSPEASTDIPKQTTPTPSPMGEQGATAPSEPK